MKKLLFLVCICLPIGTSAQVKVGQPVPDATFTTLLNAPENRASLAGLRGKVVVLEFWATWCSPCIRQMTHLQELQRAFGPKLQVITVSSEQPGRIAAFLQNRPSSLWFAVDTAQTFRAMFPFQVIPHTVLIDAGGTVRAITEPSRVDRQVVGDLLAGKAVSLPLKADRVLANPRDAMKQYYTVPAETQSRLVIQPALAGVGSTEYRYGDDPDFRNRRLTLINMPLNIICQMAYGDISQNRTISLRADRNDPSSWQPYCVDVIVPKGQEAALLPALAKELSDRFGMTGTLEKHTKPVYVLEVADPAKVEGLVSRAGTKELYMAGGDRYDGKQVTITNLVDYLENFGVLDLPVVDDTGLTARYNIAFGFEPEKKGSLFTALQGIGLRLTRSEREIQLLVVR